MCKYKYISIPGFLHIVNRKNRKKCVYSIWVQRPDLLRKESLRRGRQKVLSFLCPTTAWGQFVLQPGKPFPQQSHSALRHLLEKAVRILEIQSRTEKCRSRWDCGGFLGHLVCPQRYGQPCTEMAWACFFELCRTERLGSYWWLKNTLVFDSESNNFSFGCPPTALAEPRKEILPPFTSSKPTWSQGVILTTGSLILSRNPLL